MTSSRSAAHPVVDQVPVELADHAVVLRRSAAELQVGLDPRVALVFADGFLPLLDRLQGPSTPAGLLLAGQAAGLSAQEVTSAVQRLSAAGLLRPRSVGPSARADRRVRLVGAGPVGLPLARYLIEGGVRELAVFDARPPDPDLYPTAGTQPDQAAALTAVRRVRPGPGPAAGPLEQARDAGRRPHRGGGRGTGGRPGGHRPSPAAGPAAPAGPLARRCGLGGTAGPARTYAVPALHRSHPPDADPGWPTVLAQLGRLRLPLPALLTSGRRRSPRPRPWPFWTAVGPRRPEPPWS